MKKLKVKRFNYEVLKTEPLENLKKYRTKRRLSVFFHKGVECVNSECNKKGTQLVFGKDKRGYTHIDICDDDFYPMSVDHIIPRSKGGPNTLDNLQPMCSVCNTKKGNLLPGEEKEEKEVSTKKSKKDYYKPLDISEFKIGDDVYIGSGRKIRHLGEIIDICPNEKHPNKAMSVRIKEENYESLYPLGSIWYKR